MLSQTITTAIPNDLQAKSPIKTLDELNVTEVVSTPYFPSITEREQNCFSGEDSLACFDKLKTNLSENVSISNHGNAENLNGGLTLGFGVKRRHRCFVVTARARSFLYHQVGNFLFSR